MHYLFNNPCTLFEYKIELKMAIIQKNFSIWREREREGGGGELTYNFF